MANDEAGDAELVLGEIPQVPADVWDSLLSAAFESAPVDAAELLPVDLPYDDAGLDDDASGAVAAFDDGSFAADQDGLDDGSFADGQYDHGYDVSHDPADDGSIDPLDG